MATIDQVRTAIAEGCCPAGHPLAFSPLHGLEWGSCATCRLSWRFDRAGMLWGCPCIPGTHV